MTYRPLFTLLSLIGLAGPVLAQLPATESNDFAIRITRIDRHPATPEAARRTLTRIDAAVLEACGASGFSLTEVKRAVRRGDCWQKTMAEALRQIDNPLLRQVYAEGAGKNVNHEL